MGIRAVLMQDSHPIAFISKELSPRPQAYRCMKRIVGYNLCSETLTLLLDHTEVCYSNGSKEFEASHKAKGDNSIAAYMVSQANGV